MISFEARPDRYNHWKLSFDGPLATLALDVAEDKGLVPGYKLKLNSYDLGVDIELHDALNRVRFEHPGHYSFELLVDNHHLRSLPLHVIAGGDADPPSDDPYGSELPDV